MQFVTKFLNQYMRLLKKKIIRRKTMDVFTTEAIGILKVKHPPQNGLL